MHAYIHTTILREEESVCHPGLYQLYSLTKCRAVFLFNCCCWLVDVACTFRFDDLGSWPVDATCNLGFDDFGGWPVDASCNLGFSGWPSDTSLNIRIGGPDGWSIDIACNAVSFGTDDRRWLACSNTAVTSGGFKLLQVLQLLGRPPQLIYISRLGPSCSYLWI